MRSFRQVLVLLFALLACAFAHSSASESEVYDATVYVTSTVYRVNTVTMSGSPSASVANQTSTIPASRPSVPAVSSSIFKGNGTSTARPTGTGAQPSQPVFTGAASALDFNAYAAVFAAGVGYLVL